MYCRHCGARLQQGLAICPECGTRQRRSASLVRCGHCHRRMSVDLTVCPHCGRDYKRAGPRWGLLAVGIVLVGLTGIWGLGRLPLQRWRSEIEQTRDQLAQVAGLSDSTDPLILSTATVGPPATVAISGALAVPSAAITATPAFSLTATAAAPEAVATVVTITATAGATATVTAASTALPAETATPTASPTSTEPPPTATQPPPTATAPVPGGGTRYTVRSGDTLASIGIRFGVSWQTIAAANGLSGRSILSVGQVLIIPGVGAPLPSPTAANTPSRATRTPAPTTVPPPTYPAVALVSPGDGTPFSGSTAFIPLQWQGLAALPAGSEYEVRIRYTSNGAPQEYPYRVPVRQTGTSVPLWLWQKADQPARLYTWAVRAVQVTTDGKGGELVIGLSPWSESRSFFWN